MEVFNPKNIKKADIIVGIPSYNEANTIGFVAEQVDRGLRKYFPKKKSVIINVDNCSPDGTRQAFLNVKSKVPLVYASTPQGTKGKGLNFYNLFSLFRELDGKTGMVVDADLRSIRPEWVKKMIEPVSLNYDYAAPFYIRKKDDATITNQIVHPLVYGLLGSNVRQPIGGDFAFSKKLVDVWLDQEWIDTTYQFGIDIFMSLNAILSGLEICQVNLGKKIHKDSAPNLGPMFIQVVETLFGVLKNNLTDIKNAKEIKNIPILNGERSFSVSDSTPIWDNFEKLFVEEFDLNKSWFRKCLTPAVYNRLKKMEKDKDVNIDMKMWTKIVYDFLYYFDQENDPEIIKALRCLYFGRIASLFKQIAKLSPAEAEVEVIEQAKYFSANKDYFLSKYN